jgi:sulfur carrier protein ThiS
VPKVSFTPNLERHVHAACVESPGSTVREVLDEVFANNPRLRSYVLDDQGRLRQHVAVFVNDQLVQDRRDLSDAVEASDELFVMQALSGG